jgi:ribosomal protein S4E
MFVEQIRQQLSNGFQPFTVHLSDGREFRVPHRDFIALSRSVVVVIDEKEISHTINPLHIVSIGETAHQE